jgi:hypothetical protein
MLKAAHNASYNVRIPFMPSLRPRFLCGPLLLLSVLLIFDPRIYAENWTTSEEQLAGKIIAITGPGAIAVNVSNRSSLRTTEADEIRRGILTQLAALGIRLVNAEHAAAVVEVFFSEDLRNYLWIAEIHQGLDQPSVVMVALPRPEIRQVEHEAAAMVLHRSLLWSQRDTILDAALIDGNPTHMAVLDSNSLAIYRSQDNRWQSEQTLPITHSHPWPRDLRGRLALRNDHLFDAYLPGVYCKSTGTAPLNLNCNESDDPWPIGFDLVTLNAFFTPSRNFFTGALAPGVGRQTTAMPFYTAAALPRDKYTLWLFAAVDGQIHWRDGMTDQVTGKLRWGSDIAAIRSSCGSGWQLLVSGSEATSKDTVRAFEVRDREPIAVSEPLELNGSITALWTEAGGTSATAVLRNADTEVYEAYRISITCNGR